MFGFQDNSEREPRLIFPKTNFQDSGGYLNVERGQGIPKAFFDSGGTLNVERGSKFPKSYVFRILEQFERETRPEKSERLLFKDFGERRY